MKCRHRIIQHRERLLVVGPLFPSPPAHAPLPARSLRPVPRPLNRPRHVLHHRSRQLHKFSARPLQRKTMLILAALRIRPQRRHTAARSQLPASAHTRPRVNHTLPAPSTAPHASGSPRILRLQSQLHHFAHQRPRLAHRAPQTSRQSNAKPVPSPHHPIIRFPKPIHTARQLQPPRHILRRLMRLANHPAHQSEFSVRNWRLHAK